MTGAGDMDQPIVIERQYAASDGAGGQKVWWDKAYDVWARVQARVAREGQAEGRVNATLMADFTIYTIGDLTEKDRIVWNGETWNIRGILRSGNPLTVMVQAERGVAS